MAPSQLLWRLFAWTLSLTGLVWQLHFIIAQYTKYPVNTEITFDMPQTIHHPSFYLIGNSDRCRTNLQEFPTIAQFYSNYPDIQAIDFTPQYMSRNRSKAVRLGDCRVVYRWDPSDRFGKGKTNMELLFEVPINSSILGKYLEQFSIALDVPPKERLNEVMRPGLLNVTSIAFSYERSHVKKMPPPYTDCFDYTTNVGMPDDETCSTQCRGQRFMEELDTVSRSGVIDEQFVEKYGDRTIRFRHDIRNESLSYVRGRIDEECRLKCYRGPSCDSEYFFIDVASVQVIKCELDAWHCGQLRAQVLSPSRPDMVSNYKPAITLVDFCVYVLSMTSFWFGVSPFTIMLAVGNKWQWNEARNLTMFCLKQEQMQLRRRVEVHGQLIDKLMRVVRA